MFAALRRISVLARFARDASSPSTDARTAIALAVRQLSAPPLGFRAFLLAGAPGEALAFNCHEEHVRMSARGDDEIWVMASGVFVPLNADDEGGFDSLVEIVRGILDSPAREPGTDSIPPVVSPANSALGVEFGASIA